MIAKSSSSIAWSSIGTLLIEPKLAKTLISLPRKYRAPIFNWVPDKLLFVSINAPPSPWDCQEELYVELLYLVKWSVTVNEELVQPNTPKAVICSEL